jgi:hypothetical protein
MVPESPNRAFLGSVRSRLNPRAKNRRCAYLHADTVGSPRDPEALFPQEPEKLSGFAPLRAVPFRAVL